METHLGPSAYIVLGLIERFGPATSYELKARADESVGHFWSFPRSGLYAEPQRLAGLGLLREEQDAGGRRKRTFHLTEEGQAVLTQWLREGSEAPELRDTGLLKLYLSRAGEAHLPALAASQRALHETQLSEYVRLLQSGVLDADPTARQTLELGRRYAAMCAEFWAEVEQQFGGHR